MDFKQVIYQRRSIRKYTTQQVEQEMVTRLLDSAVQAPSAMNSQPWAFAVIQNTALLQDLSTQAKNLLLENMDNFPVLAKYQTMLANPDYDIFYGAPTLLITYARNSNQHSIEDCCLAAQNIMLTAYDLGLGSCWIGFARPLLNTVQLKQRLQIPSEYSAVAPIIIGYPQIELPRLQKKEPEILIWER